MRIELSGYQKAKGNRAEEPETPVGNEWEP